jgi:Ca2+-binding EF-hand superfamily protein
MAALAPLAFSAEEEAKLRALFDHIDTEHKGYITHDNLRHLCSELGHEMKAEKAEELILRCDPDKVGKIHFEPFVKCMSTAIPKLIVAIILIGAFKKLDKGETGYIERAALEKLVYDAGAKIEKARLDELIAKANPLPDGRIEFKLFVAGLAAHLRSV